MNALRGLMVNWINKNQIYFFNFVVCIFAYGQTSSGKTFTMKGSQQNPGIIPISFSYIFSKIKEVFIYWFLFYYFYIIHRMTLFK